MPSWGEILEELQTVQINPPADMAPGVPPFDYVRRKYVRQLAELTGRNVVVYATSWLNPRPGVDTAITLRDVQGLMEVFRGLNGDDGLDLIIHSPGGSPEAADRLVRYMRSKFDSVRAFVPHAAMSAATMWALACDEVVMGKHSQLGPTDPQVQLSPTMPPRAAGELRDEFEAAVTECRNDPARLSAWLPILQQYPPGLLQQCKDWDVLGKELVQEWLATWMLAEDEEATEKSREIAEFFGDHKVHKSHARGIDREQVREHGVKVVNLEDDQNLQDAVLSVHHAVMHTLSGTQTCRLVENHLGRAWIEASMQVPIMMPGMSPGGTMPGMS